MPAPRAGGLGVEIAVVRVQVAAHAHRVLAPGGVAEAPEIARRYIFVGEAVVLLELLRGLRRAVRGEILGEAQGTRRVSPSLRATMFSVPVPPMRMPRSKPSSTRSTMRSKARRRI
jgi:hypothetical protein